MAFLSGVLSNIKEHLGQHKSEINEAIKALSDTKTNGFKKYVSAIDAVSKGVGMYNTKVKSENNNVKRKITDLIEHVTVKFTSAIAGIPTDEQLRTWTPPNDENVTATNKLASTYVQHGVKFEQNMKDRQTKINDLNKDLRAKICHVRENIKHETTRLKTLASREESQLKETKVKIKEVSNSLTMRCNEHICSEVKKLVRETENVIGYLIKDLKDIDKELTKYVNDIQTWIVDADELVKPAIRDATLIGDKWLAGDKEDGIREKTTALEKMATDLYWHFSRTKDNVENNVKTALARVKSMDGKLKEDLYKVKNAVDQKVRGIKNKIGKLYETVSGTKSAVADRDKKIENILTEIYAKLNTIKGPKGGSVGLEGIKAILLVYTEAFGDNKFKNTIVPKWINDIIDNDGLVKVHLGLYSDFSKKKHFGISYQNIGSYEIGDRIKKQLKEEIKTKLYDIPNVFKSIAINKEDIHQNVKEVQVGIQQFSSTVELHLKKYQGDRTELNKVAGEIVQKIEHMLEVKDASSRERDYSADDLQLAIEYTFIALLYKASQTAKVLKNIALKSPYELGTNVVNALRVASELDNTLESTTQPNSDSNPAKAVDTAINKVTETLNEEIGASDAAKITKLSDEKFSNYRGFVDQSDDKLAALSTDNFKAIKGAGTLPAAIGAIRDKANEDFESSKHTTQDSKKFKDFASEITKNLKALLEAYAAKGKDVKKILEELKNVKIAINKKGVAGSLQEIHDKLHSLRSADLKKVIDATTGLFTFIKTRSQQTIDDLEKHVASEVTTASANLTAYAQKQYITSVRQLLTDFTDKVRRELEPLPSDIENDRHVGFKGFMEKLYGEYTTELLDCNIKKLKDHAGDKSVKIDNFAHTFKQFLDPLNAYLQAEITRVAAQHNKNNSTPHDANNYLSNYRRIAESLNDLLEHIHKYNNYDHNLPGMLVDLASALSQLKPKGFSHPSTAILDCIASGLNSFIEQLNKVYISTYDGGLTISWEGEKAEDISQDGRNCGKVCMTIIEILFNEFQELRTACQFDGKDNVFNKKHIRLYDLDSQGTPTGNPLGEWFQQRGFRVSDNEETHNGELRNKGCDGNYMYMKLLAASGGIYDKFYAGPVVTLQRRLKEYYRVCHISTASSTRRPCSVYEMLCWLTSLQHNSVYLDLTTDGYTHLLDKPAKPANTKPENDAISIEDSSNLSLKAYPRKITHGDIHDAIVHLTFYAHTLLTTIAGYGDEFSTYACEFFTNHLKFHYPSDPSDCFEMLVDIVGRFLPPLRFLQSKCKMSTQHHGWERCEYGKASFTTKSQCNNHSSDRPNYQPNDQPTCQPTSTLMSYLNDCLPGHLPHHLTSIGCKPKCSTCPRGVPGMPCITPLGFKAFSGSAKTGRDLCDTLDEFFDDVDLSALLSVVSMPPSTLPEHFQFALNLVNGWYESNQKSKNGFQRHLYDAITKQSIRLYNEPGVLTDALRNAYCSQPTNYGNAHTSTNHSDVFSLTLNNHTKNCADDKQCSQYLGSLSADSHYYFAYRNCNLYLSWAIYLPWTFWDLLNNLYSSFCSINCQDWGCRGCLRGDKCKKGEHGVVDKEKPNNKCQCRSIVDCKGVAPTLYQYGFVFGEASTLNGESPKKCSDFCSQLKNVLQSQYFKDLFTECDKFIWTIREPFTYLVLALWSLSLFYLICVMVGRLDVLHIRSHLRIPSSHKITAQSLLAAAQVGRLAKISYLQP